MKIFITILLAFPYIMAAMMFFTLGWAANRDGFQWPMVFFAVIGWSFMGWIEARVMHKIADLYPRHRQP